MGHHFYIVDVFAERLYSGNQLAVVVGEQALPGETMQLVAAETNYSETTFVSPLPEENGGYRVREDPATGNGAAFLGAYLLEHRFLFASPFSLRIEQGYEMGRPSLVRLRARRIDASREVSVGGSVIPVVRGELL